MWLLVNMYWLELNSIFTSIVFLGATSTVLTFLGISERQEFNEFDEARLAQNETKNYLASSHWFNKLDQR